MSKWEVRTLGEVCRISGGGTPSKERSGFWGGDIPWVSPKDMKFELIFDSQDKITEEAIARSATKRVKPQSILIVVRSGILAHSIPLGRTTSSVTINQDLKALTFGKEIDPEFAHYQMKANERELLDRVTRGATVHRLTSDTLKSLPFLIPPLPVQREIVERLDAAFGLIDRARANVERCVGLAGEVWEGASAKKFAELLYLGHSDFENVISLQGGSQPPKFKYSKQKGYIRFLQIRDFKRDDKIAYIPISSKNRTCRENDVLIGRYGASVGNICTGLSGAYNVALIKASPKSPKLDNLYLYYYLRSGLFQSALVDVSERSAQNGFSKQDVAKFAVPVPTLEQQNSAVELLISVEELTDRLLSCYRTTILQLDDLRASILEKAFTGDGI